MGSKISGLTRNLSVYLRNSQLTAVYSTAKRQKWDDNPQGFIKAMTEMSNFYIDDYLSIWCRPTCYVHGGYSYP